MIGKRLTLVQRFSLLAFLSITLLSLALGLVISHYLTRNMLDREWETTAAIVRAQVEEHALYYLFSQQVSKDPEGYQELVAPLKRVPEVVRVKVYDRQGRITWSDDPRLIGRTFEHNKELQEALQGRIASNLQRTWKAEHLYERQFPRLIEVYVPIFTQEGQEVVGVVEAYKHPRHLFEELKQAKARIWGTTLGGGLLLYLALLGIVIGAQRTQTRLEEALKSHAQQLEEKVEKRTKDLQETAKHLAALNAVSREISSLLDLDRILNSVVEKARELLGREVAALCLLDPDGHLSLRAASGPAEAFHLDCPREDNGRLSGGISPLMCLRREEEGSPVCIQGCSVVRERYQQAHIAIPLRMRDNVIGALCVADRVPRVLSKAEVDLLTGLASQAAIAIENVQLHEQVQRLAVMEERERIAMDLHDGIVQSIYAIGLNLESCSELMEQGPMDVRQRLEGAISDLNDVIRDVRSYIFDLRLGSSQRRELKQVLTDAVKAFKINSLLQVELVVGEIEAELSEEEILHLSHIVHEAVANVVKHAQASSVLLRLFSERGSMVLSIKDNGVGFDPGQAESAGGQGLRNMAERARALRGTLAVESGSGRGTEVVVKVPLTRDRGRGEDGSKPGQDPPR